MREGIAPHTRCVKHASGGVDPDAATTIRVSGRERWRVECIGICKIETFFTGSTDGFGREGLWQVAGTHFHALLIEGGTRVAVGVKVLDRVLEGGRRLL